MLDKERLRQLIVNYLMNYVAREPEQIADDILVFVEGCITEE